MQRKRRLHRLCGRPAQRLRRDRRRALRLGMGTNVSIPETNIFTDISGGTLPAVSWVIPEDADSDHPGDGTVDNGPSWVASVVNAVGESSYWNSTASSSSGTTGAASTITPRRSSSAIIEGGLGFRVPMLVVSAYAKCGGSKGGYISHTQYEFGSILQVHRAELRPGVARNDRRAREQHRRRLRLHAAAARVYADRVAARCPRWFQTHREAVLAGRPAVTSGVTARRACVGRAPAAGRTPGRAARVSARTGAASARSRSSRRPARSRARRLRRAEATEEVLGEAQDARRLVLHVRDVALLGVRRDDEQRHAEAQAVVVFVRRRDVVVEAAPVVPLHEDRGRIPELALADGVDESGDPRRPVSAAARRRGRRSSQSGVIQVKSASLPARDVGDERFLRDDHVSSNRGR